MCFSSSKARTATAAMSRSWISDRPAPGDGIRTTSPVRNSSAHSCVFAANPPARRNVQSAPALASITSISPHTPLAAGSSSLTFNAER
jgi:hypothetical protein